MKILGFNDGHNAAIAFLDDGKLIYAIQEERIKRIKNAGDFPYLALDEIIKTYKIQDSIFVFNGLYMNYRSTNRESIITEYENSKKIKASLKSKLKNTKNFYHLYQIYKNKDRKTIIKNLFGPEKINNIRMVEHHMAHAAAAYYGWSKEGKILILTCDGCGDGLCATVNIGENGKIERIVSISQDNSIGRLYAYVTYLMGMMPLEHEYKVMGLSPYTHYSHEAERVYKKFNNLFEFEKKNNGMTWKRKKGIPSMYAPRNLINSLVYRERFDLIAAGLQLFIEDFLKQWIKNCIENTGIHKIALSGGVFMNVKANQKILELSEVEELFVFPSCGDESNAIGAAYWIYSQEKLNSNETVDIKPLKALYLGNDITDQEIEQTLKSFHFSQPPKIEYYDDIEEKVSELLAKGEIVARAKGRMEFGARALGNRSILANPSNPKVIRIINEMIKNRDFWMPFCPSVLAERTDDYYIKPKPMSAPYMIITFDSRPEKRDKFIAACHSYDFTTRPQEVYKDWNFDYWRLLKYYEDLTGEGIILNTSFNLHGYPIVCNAYDALDVFGRSGLQCLALNNFLIRKI